MRNVWLGSVVFSSLLIVALLLTPATMGQTEPTNQFLHKLIEQTAPKMVKVYGAGTGRVEGYATGFVVSSDGQILTSQGVFLDGRQVRVVLADGTEHQATILKRDRIKQIALLKITASTPKYFELADKKIGEKGDWIIAVSNAFKVAEKTEPLSAMIGIISLRTSMEAKLNRRAVAYRGELILIDPITSNPGANGGAVVTMDGKLAGMIGKIINSSETNTRLNYAVPLSELYRFVKGNGENQVTATTSRKKADLGIKLFKHGGRGGPAYVDRVVRGGPAAEAKLKPDDLIITLAGEKVGNLRQYDDAIGKLTPGEEVVVVVKRGLEMIRVPITPREKK